PDNALLVIAGDIDVDSTVRLVRQRLSSFSSRPGPQPALGRSMAPRGPLLIVQDSLVSSTNVGLVFPAPPRNSPDFLAYLVVDQLLFGGRREVTDSAYFARSLGTSLGHRLVAALDALN